MSKIKANTTEATVSYYADPFLVATVTGDPRDFTDTISQRFPLGDTAGCVRFLAECGADLNQDIAEILVAHAAGRKTIASYYPEDNVYRMHRTGKNADQRFC